MYHPDAMMTVAHTRETELIREAKADGMSRNETDAAPTLARRALVWAPVMAVLAFAITLLMA